MVRHKAVSLCVEAQVDLANPADEVRPDDVILSAAELAGLAGRMVVGGVEQGLVKPHSIVWCLRPLTTYSLDDGHWAGTAITVVTRG